MAGASRLTSNPGAPQPILETLARDPDVNVRWLVARWDWPPTGGADQLGPSGAGAGPAGAGAKHGGSAGAERPTPTADRGGGPASAGDGALGRELLAPHPRIDN